MNSLEIDLHGNDEIFNVVKELTSDDRLGNKLQIVRMFTTFKREEERMHLEDALRERVGKRIVKDVILITEDCGIVVLQKTRSPEDGVLYQPVSINHNEQILYNTLDQALIGLVCLKANTIGASDWINKMIGIDSDRI